MNNEFINRVINDTPDEKLKDKLTTIKEELSLNPGLIDDTHDEDVEDIVNTAESAKVFLERGEYKKVLDNLNHIIYLTQYL